MGQRYPLPITLEMLVPANPRFGYPRYNTTEDWSQGFGGNDVDTATRTEAVLGSSSAADIVPYPIYTQTDKAAAMAPPLEVLGDLGMDYGGFTGDTGRTGYIEPGMPYGPPPETP